MNCDTYYYGLRIGQSYVNDQAVLDIVSDNSAFSGNILEISTTYDGSSDFNMISINDKYKQIFTLNTICSIRTLSVRRGKKPSTAPNIVLS